MIKFKFVLFLFVFLFTFNFISSTEVSSEMALNEITGAKAIIQEMVNNNFSVLSMQDVLVEAEKAYKKAYYAEILKSSNASLEQLNEARTNLALVNYRKINYSEVLMYTDQIKEMQKEAVRIYDLISLSESKLNNVISLSVEDMVSLNSTLEDARIAFFSERYNESDTLLSTFSAAFDKARVNQASMNSLKTGVKNFFQRYWAYILVFLLIAGIAFYFAYKKQRISNLEKAIHKMKFQEISLHELIKEAQTDRFKKNSISGIVYNIRVKKYNDLLTKIKQELPVLEDTLKGLKKRK